MSTLNTQTELPRLNDDILDAIQPTAESVRSGVLGYANLDYQLSKHAPYSYDRWNTLEQAATAIEGEDAARELALQYLLMTAVRVNSADSEDSRTLWSNRYTTASSELYGIPDSAEARRLLVNQLNELREPAQDLSVEQAVKVAGYMSIFNVDSATDELREEVMIDSNAETVREYILDTYASIFELFDDIEVPSDGITPEIAGSLFKRALSILSSSYDADWSGWSVDLDPNQASLSVLTQPDERKISVGLKRVNMRLTELKGLTAHEILVHASRAVNGAKHSPEFGTGLPGYLSAEEGLGVYFEYAITGIVPEKIVDRYVDIALALGLAGNEPFTRERLLDFCLLREQIRNSNRPDSQRLSQETLEKQVYQHVNRIYRGSLGDHHIGVFTKDIAYYDGFKRIKDFIDQELEGGSDIGELIDYLLCGKFDPTKPEHTMYVASL